MIESTFDIESKLDFIFFSLSDATRRDIIKRVSVREYNIGELANLYDMSLNAVSKHIMILERASWVSKKRKGKFSYVYLSPKPFQSMADYLDYYKQFWEDKLNSLEKYLSKDD